MSQIQVIGREAVDDTNNMRDNAQKQAELQATIADKRATLNFYSQELEYKKKVTENEVKKAELTDKAERAKLLLKVFDDASKSADPQQYLANVAKMNIDLVSTTLGDPEFQKLASKMKPSGDERNKAANADLIENYNRGNTAPQINAINNPNVIGDTIQGAGGPVGTPPMGGAQWRPKTTGPGGVTGEFYNPDEEIALAVRKQSALDDVAMEKEIAPVRIPINNYLSAFDRAIEEIGGLETNALAALAKGKFNEAAAQVGDKPNVFALGKMLKSVGLSLGSYLNRGRPTAEDAMAAENMLVRLTYTKGVNEILRRNLEDVVKNKDKNLASDLYWYMAYKGGSRTPDAIAYGKGINPLEEKPFTIRVKRGQ